MDLVPLTLIGALQCKTKVLNRELLNIEKEAITTANITDEKRDEMMEKLQQWIRKKEKLTEHYALPAILLQLCHDSLDLLSWLESTTLDARIKTLHTHFTSRNAPYRGDPFDEDSEEVLERAEAEKKKLEEKIVAAKEKVNEIIREMGEKGNEDMATKWVAKWVDMPEIRLKVVQTGVELSIMLAHFLVYLELTNNDAKVQLLQRRIKTSFASALELINHAFLKVIDDAKRLIKSIPDDMKPKEGSFEKEEVLDIMAKEFFVAILHLDGIMSTLTTPITRGMVTTTRARVENMVGQMLYAMQALRLRVRKIRNRKHKKEDESWKGVKGGIAASWMMINLAYLQLGEGAAAPAATADDEDVDANYRLGLLWWSTLA